MRGARNTRASLGNERCALCRRCHLPTSPTVGAPCWHTMAAMHGAHCAEDATKDSVRLGRRGGCVQCSAVRCGAVRCGAVRALALHTPAEGFECTDWARRARARALRCDAASDAPPFRTPMQLARSCTMALASRVHLSAAVPHQRAKSEFPLAPRKEEKKECCSCRRGEAR
jgi:hypothetical protein